jgi:hypothetical protein
MIVFLLDCIDVHDEALEEEERCWITYRNDTLSLFQPQEIRILTNEYSTDVRVASVYEMILFKLYRYNQDQVSR